MSGIDNSLNYIVIDASYISIVGPAAGLTGPIVIPSTINFPGPDPSSGLYPVQDISANAFLGYNEITSINMSNNINLITINKEAFKDCHGITSIDLSGCNNLITINSQAFYNCFETLTINFTNCISLTTIDFQAFEACFKTSSINFTNCISLNTIADCAFGAASGIDNVALLSINLTDSILLSNIGSQAFVRNINLDSITFGGMAPTIISDAFEFIKTTAKIYVNWWATGYSSSYGDNPIVPVSKIYSDISYVVVDSTSSIISHTSALQNALGNINLLNGTLILPTDISGYTLVDISDVAFTSCSNLVSVDCSQLAELVTIGPGAFFNCLTLTSIDLNNCINLTTIGDTAFSNCNLLNITIPNNVTSFGELTFWDNSNLISITFNGSCPTDLNTNGANVVSTPFLNLPYEAKIYVYYAYSSTNPAVGITGFAISYLRGSVIPVIVLDAPILDAPIFCPCPKPIYYTPLQHLGIMGSARSSKRQMAAKIKNDPITRTHKSTIISVNQSRSSGNRNPNNKS